MNHENFIATAGRRALIDGPHDMAVCVSDFRTGSRYGAVWLMIVKSTVKGKLL